jgi:hypothetical protein
MTNEKFDEMLERRVQLIRSVLKSKGREYTNSQADRFHNFNRAGNIQQISREKALVGMFTKHLVSILDIVDNIETERPTYAVIEEKIGDAINYLVLLEGVLKEDCSF